MKRPKLTDYLTSKFTTAAAESAPIKKSREGKRPSPISLRLNETELAALRKASAGRSMNGYIRERLFGNAAAGSSSEAAVALFGACFRIRRAYWLSARMSCRLGECSDGLQ